MSLRYLFLNRRSLVAKAVDGRDNGARLRDLDGDGVCEILVANAAERVIFRWDAGEQAWDRTPAVFPEPIVDQRGRDASLRFVDVTNRSRIALTTSAGSIGLCRMQAKSSGLKSLVSSPVTMTIGIWHISARPAISRCTSRPLRRGRLRSSTTTAGIVTSR